MSDDIESEMAPFIKAILERKAVAPVLLHVQDMTSLADVFLICSGRSNRQVAAIAESVRRDLKGQGIRLLSMEGEKEGHWILMDYGHVIIHVFYEPMRSFYDLEGLWADAPRIRFENPPMADPSKTEGLEDD